MGVPLSDRGRDCKRVQRGGFAADKDARAAYGSNAPRLTEIKRRYDPDNVFRQNANVLPASG